MPPGERVHPRGNKEVVEGHVGIFFLLLYRSDDSSFAVAEDPNPIASDVGTSLKGVNPRQDIVSEVFASTGHNAPTRATNAAVIVSLRLVPFRCL